MDKDKLGEVMQDLERSGAPDMQALRSRLFSFEDVILLTLKARVALFDSISTRTRHAGAAQCAAGADRGGSSPRSAHARAA